ncbi:MAG: amino acid permease [Candidatus Eremiobacteraeota bacterium]|nr:amino acid permease [Candidatus Eremiobacteraeota bacterium]
MSRSPVNPAARGLAPKLGTFDAILIVMGGIIGSGIFATPSVVAARVGSAPAIVAAWALGGLIASIGGFVFAELAWRRPASGGLYGYMRDAYHPVVAFMYGWTALLISQSGGMAAAAITFGSYVAPSLGGAANAPLFAIASIALLTAINCFGVREGGNVQNVLMLLKIGVIVAVIVAGAVAPVATHVAATTFVAAGFGAAMVPVLFAYDGFQTATFVDGEVRDPKRTMSRGLMWGVAAVVVLYMAVTLAGLRTLGTHGLGATATPASQIMQIAFGSIGAHVVVVGVALSTFGFLSNQVLTSPRIYFAMARDGLFFKGVARVHPRTQVPVVAIVLQGIVAIVITLSGRYDQILNYVTSIDFVFMALAAGAVIIFRRRGTGAEASGISVPGHPWTTAFFLVASIAIVINTLVAFPGDTLIGLALLVLGAPVYVIWKRFSRERP